MLRGKATAPRAAALETYLVTVSDHGMNASTFTARVIASTGSDMVSAVVGAIGALKGPLHGGAPGPVLDMLDAIGRPRGGRGLAGAGAARRPADHGDGPPHLPDPRPAGGGAGAGGGASGGGRATAHRRLALARAVEHAAEDVLRRAPPGPGAAGQRGVLHRGAARRGGPPAARRSARSSRAGGWRAGCAHVDEQRADRPPHPPGVAVRRPPPGLKGPPSASALRQGDGQRAGRCAATRARQVGSHSGKRSRNPRRDRHSSSSSGRAHRDSASARLLRNSSPRRSGSMLASARDSAFRSHPHTATIVSPTRTRTRGRDTSTGRQAERGSGRNDGAGRSP